MLTGAIDDGIANGAAVAGYSIAGKTGTAQVAGPVNVRVQTGTDANGQPIYVDTTRQAYVEGWWTRALSASLRRRTRAS